VNRGSGRKAKQSPVDPHALGRHGILIPPACKIFEDLGVGGSLIFEGVWYPIHGRADLLNYEIEHGRISERYEYNDRCFGRAERERSSVLGQHRGFSDLFVPVGSSDRMRALLVVGPFGTAWPSGAELHERWRSLTGAQGHLSDAAFAHYVSTTLSLTVFEPKEVLDFQRLLECLARLLVLEEKTERIWSEFRMLRERLMGATFVARIWEAARLMSDDRTRRVWSASSRKNQRPDLHLSGFPEHAAVGLLVSGKEDVEPVDDFVRRNAFQRACVELAARRGDVISGKVGDYGVTFLSVSRGSQERSKRWLSELTEQAASLARRRFGLGVRFGTSTLPSSVSLPRQAQAALAAAESALSDDVPVVHAKSAMPVGKPLGKLRQELARLIEIEPAGLAARFDRFLDAVAIRTAFRPEPARVHLEVAFEQMTERLLRGGELEPRGFELLAATLTRSAGEAQTSSELFGAYRRAVRDLAQAVQRPVTARRERSMRRADEYLSQHYADPITLADAARVAGFAPNYFSMLFHKEHGICFEQHLQDLRLARAKELLTDTTHNLQRIARASGFSRASYLSRVFKARTSKTPIEYRWSARHLPREPAKRRPKRA
jgi:AraC-like DNA-binding protein